MRSFNELNFVYLAERCHFDEQKTVHLDPSKQQGNPVVVPPTDPDVSSIGRICWFVTFGTYAFFNNVSPRFR